MLLTEGLRQFVEPHCVQRELAEVTGLTADELDHAAHELIRRTASDPTSFPAGVASRSPVADAAPPAPSTGDRPRRPPYYEHLGGYSFDELKDYNRHSPLDETPGVALPLPVAVRSPVAGGRGRTSTAAAAAAAAAFRAGDLRARVSRSDDFGGSGDYDHDDYGGPIYTTSV